MSKRDEIALLALQCVADGWGYIYGTAGEKWTQAKHTSMCTARQNDSNYRYSIQYGAKWIGHTVADCSGLVKYLFKQIGITLPHGSNSLYKGTYLQDKGTLDSSMIPALKPADLLFKYNSTDGYHHVGVYVGDGMVVEAQGTQAGVLKSSVKGWTHWGRVLPPEEGKEVAPMVDKAGVAIVTAKTGKTVNARVSPSTKGKILKAVPIGNTVEVLNVENGWAKILYTEEAYMMAEFLEEAETL